MEYSGNLQDMSLAQLLERVCQSERQLVIVIQQPDLTSGFITVGNNRVLHAETNTLQGESALGEMLSWQQGAFHMEHELVSRSQNGINKPLNELLAQFKTVAPHAASVNNLTFSAVSTDDPATIAPTNGAQLPPASHAFSNVIVPTENGKEAATRDNERAYHLIKLLSKLEASHAEIVTHLQGRHPSRVIDVIVDMANVVRLHLDGLTHSRRKRISLAAVLNRSAKQHTTIRLITIQKNQLSAQHAQNYLKGIAKQPSAHAALQSALIDAVLSILTTLLLLVLNQFETSDATNEWNTILHDFIVEIERVVTQQS